MQLSKFYNKTHNKNQDPGSGRAEMHQGRLGTSSTKPDSGCALGLVANLLHSSVPEEGGCVSPVRY